MIFIGLLFALIVMGAWGWACYTIGKLDGMGIGKFGKKK